ncbi:MAG: class 1 fructose-bisphosphatase [Patescibacteria group bacterium]|nr:class 1 fructose-bisphosphatase [Patescibacteria group bacterium]
MDQGRGTSFMEFLAREQAGMPSGLSQVVSSIVAGCGLIHKQVNLAGLADVLGVTGATNVQGETVQKLDAISRDIIVRHCLTCDQIAAIATEEDEQMIPGSGSGPFLVTLDPLDGSSNIDVNVGVGTIFSVWLRPLMSRPVQETDFLQAGTEQLVAGYIIYGSSTMLVITLGKGVNGFTFDPGAGLFLLSHSNIRIPDKPKYFSVNEGNWSRWAIQIQTLVSQLKDRLSARYIGSLVADFHRNLLKGGIFLYPADTKSPGGKLRYLYEVATMSLLAERAGGRASTGSLPALQHRPTALHERVPFFVGNQDEVEQIERTFAS